MPAAATIVIPTYNRVDLLAQCLASSGLAQLRGRAEIIVADNGSTDGTAEFLAGQPFVRMLKLPGGTSYARSCNAAAAIASSAYLVFLNNDTVPAGGWLKPLISWLEHADVGAVGSVLRYPNGNIQHAGVSFSPKGLPGNVRLARRTFATDHIFLQAITGAALGIRTETFQRIGRFDERFHNSYEDVDLCLRLRRAGKRNILVTTPDIVHLESQTAGRHTHDRANRRRFAAIWSSSCVPDQQRILASLDGATSPVEVIRLPPRRWRRSSATPARAHWTHAVSRERLSRSQADTIMVWQTHTAPPALAARTPVSYWDRRGSAVGVAFARRQLEHVGLPATLTVRGLLDGLRTAYVDARVAVR